MGNKRKGNKKNGEEKKQEILQNNEIINKNQIQEQQKIELIKAKKVSYCPNCSFPFELCQYGKEVNQCILILNKIAPTKVKKYHPNFENIDQIKENKELKKQIKPQLAKKQKSVKQKYIVIDIKNRGKKKFVTTVSNLNTFNIDSKQLAKKCNKLFACSCSSKQIGELQIQGDKIQEIKQILIIQYKIKKKFIIEQQQFIQKYQEQINLKKKQKKQKSLIIKQQLNQQQQKQKQKQQQNKNIKNKNDRYDISQQSSQQQQTNK